MIKLSSLLKVLDCDTITVCYAGFGERIYEGKLKDFTNEHYLNFYVTYISPNFNHAYIEIHENKNFIDEEFVKEYIGE